MGSPDRSSVVYDKSTEKAEPGYYRVNFPDPSIRAELTATNGTGWQKFTFMDEGNGWIMIDLSASLEPLLKEEHRIAGNVVEGSVQAPTNCKNDNGVYKFWFNLEIDHAADSVVEKGSVIWYFFRAEKGTTVNVKTSISSISPARAGKDRLAEIGDADFETIRRRATERWDEKLGKIAVTGNPEYVKLFYTHYYHSMLSPSDISSPSGNYRGSDSLQYLAKDYIHYHGWSVWDNFRTEFPLLTITEPEVMNDICRSLCDLYREGKLPLATRTEPFPTARTEHSLVVVLDCLSKGINRFDLESVYPLMVREAEQNPWSTPDKKLETAYDYWALSRIAKLLNKKEDAERFISMAAKYKEIWREKFLVMDDKSDIMHGDGLYEGTLWQYRWFVPYDMKGVMDMVGGKDVFTGQLQYFFDNNLYNHGNEPDIHVPFLFNMTDNPAASQKIVNQILTKEIRQNYGTHVKWKVPYNGRIYKNDPAGYMPEMDDDAGTMSAWYVLASMGIYPVCVGEPVYTLTAPIFSSVRIQLPGNKSFSILAKNLSEENFYIQRAVLNGKELKRSWITHQEITGGGTLEFFLGNTPSETWGTKGQYVTSLESTTGR
jgi:putative alpha-1,2-mannosidase